MLLILGFAELTAAAILITKAITNDSFSQVVKGHAREVYDANQKAGSSTSSSASTASAAASATAVNAATGAMSVNAKGVPSLPFGTALTGAAATAWAAAILTALGAPVNSANEASMRAWFEREGGGGANNPLNTTLANTPGNVGSFGVGVKDYATPQDGIEATVSTLEGGYGAIVSALRAGQGLSGGSPGVASELLAWSGNGYSSV